MLNIGRFHRLKVLETGSHGAILEGDQSGRLTLALSQCPGDLVPGNHLDVFIYLDVEGNPTPTTHRPAAELGEVAWLKVVEANNLGAFVDWGLPKDLFIPFAEQQHTLTNGSYTLVRVYQDNQGRLAGSTRIDHWIKDDSDSLKQGQKVSLVVADQTDLGFKAIINHTCWGLLYGNELYQRIRKGQVIDGYVKRIREDGKVDLSMNQPGFSKSKMGSVSHAILTSLDENNGFLPLTDKSPPPDIYAAFGVSKKVFKQAVGSLYRQRKISLENDGIRLT